MSAEDVIGQNQYWILHVERSDEAVIAKSVSLLQLHECRAVGISSFRYLKSEVSCMSVGLAEIADMPGLQAGSFADGAQYLPSLVAADEAQRLGGSAGDLL